MKIGDMTILLVFTAAGCGRTTLRDVNATDAFAEPDAARPVTDAASGTCVHVPVEAKCHDRFCLIPAGCFIMGSPHDEPMRGRYNEEQHEVTLTHSFLVQRTELTQAEWTSAGLPNPTGTISAEWGGDCITPECPAGAMTWFEAVTYANDRSKHEGREPCIELIGCTGEIGIDFDCASYRQTTTSYYECNGYRLPTVAEYQYAVRAGTTTTFYSGPFDRPSDRCVEMEHLNEAAWYCANAGATTHPVGQKKPNAWGLHDMMGNAAEFLASDPNWFDPEPGPMTDPYQKLRDGGAFALAGGPFFAWPALMRAANAGGALYVSGVPRDKQLAPGMGIRLVRSLPPAEAKAW